MSAFICDPDTIKCLAGFAAHTLPWRGPRVNPNYFQRYLPEGVQPPGPHDTQALATFYANVLWQENIRSVQTRYADTPAHALPGPVNRPDELTVSYADCWYAKASLVEILKACDCYEYQTCETADWEQTLAIQVINRIRRAAITELPGYDDAPWG